MKLPKKNLDLMEQDAGKEEHVRPEQSHGLVDRSNGSGVKSLSSRYNLRRRV